MVLFFGFFSTCVSQEIGGENRNFLHRVKQVPLSMVNTSFEFSSIEAGSSWPLLYSLIAADVNDVDSS